MTWNRKKPTTHGNGASPTPSSRTTPTDGSDEMRWLCPSATRPPSTPSEPKGRRERSVAQRKKRRSTRAASRLQHHRLYHRKRGRQTPFDATYFRRPHSNSGRVLKEIAALAAAEGVDDGIGGDVGGGEAAVDG
mmetsp:Transcript_37758/g.121171  ORF Transcript_37758/g.121171 Transcript_37758/m.121171 type:complete len:134 (+) Transcript_37758:398-799(+)